MSTPVFRVVAIACALAAASISRAATITLTPAKDNTIFEQVDDPATFSNGAGSLLYIGRTGDRDGGLIRRSLFAFNVAAALPADATVTAATLTLKVDRSGASGSTQTVTLARLLADWGEGTGASLGGSGGGAGGPDATWTHRFFNDPASRWLTPGADFADAPSAVGSLGPNGSYTLADPQLAADVQSWLANPAANFGWILRGDEATLQSAKQIESREAAIPPVLTVMYSVPEPTTTILSMSALTLLAGCRNRRR